MKEFGIGTGTANGDVLRATVRLSGEVVLNDNLAAHIVPKVSGNVQKVLVNLGDRVQEGQALAELESRELADAKADYVAAKERAALANTNFERFQSLWDQKITSEQEYLEVRNVFRESEIVLKASEQKLFALDVSPNDLSNISSGNGHQLTHFELKAPLDGEVIERNIARGEFIDPDSRAFIVADLSTVWVDLTVYEAQLSLVRRGQNVTVTSRYGNAQTEGIIEYVSPVVDPSTRTATARVVLDNTDGQWPPGTFVDAVIAVNSIRAGVVIPRDAVQTIDNETIVFVQDGDVFETVVVQLGRQDDRHVEIVSGLEAGQTYVAQNAFALKAELGRSGLEHAGHAH
jgi:cobalt-zinc-cadmium efflux system membrane fusion protein